jgi:DNA-binding response OmpR family regulator
VGGTIEVSVRKEAGADKVTIEVCDTGPGIPKELEPSLFTVFSSHQTSGASSGTGIGLALSKELVQLHGGELSYSPVPKGGACFTITLKALGETSKISEYKEVPPSENILKEQKTNTDEKSKKNLHTLLIVEDNDELRNFLRMQLSEEYTVAEAADGKDGLEKAIALQPDIILSDIMMPVMDGIALLDSLKNNFDTSHIPVVLLTARSSVESKIEGLRYGADAYLTKPFNSDQLKAQLMNLLRQRVQLRKYFTQYSESKQITLNTLLTSKDADFLQQVRNIIESNLTNPEFRMEDIHKQVAMGRSKFFDKMKGLTGIAPIEFIREIRLNKAYDLLLSGKCNVTEASYLSGFADAGYFSKSFKEKFGVSPSLLIKNKTENSNP